MRLPGRGGRRREVRRPEGVGLGRAGGRGRAGALRAGLDAAAGGARAVLTGGAGGQGPPGLGLQVARDEPEGVEGRLLHGSDTFLPTTC